VVDGVEEFLQIKIDLDAVALPILRLSTPGGLLYRAMGSVAKAVVRKGGPEQVTEHPCDALLHHHSVQYTGDTMLAHPPGLLGDLNSEHWRRLIGSFEQLSPDRSPLRPYPFQKTCDIDTIEARGSPVGSDLFPCFGYTRIGYEVFYRCIIDRR
jgi:hypothetical protein